MSGINFKSTAFIFLAGVLFGSSLYLVFNLPPYFSERRLKEDPFKKIEKLKKKLAQMERKLNLNAKD